MENLYFTVNTSCETKRIKDLLPKYLSGVWGDYSNNENGIPVLRSTEQNVEGVLNIVNPAILEIKKVGKNNKLKNKDLLLTKSSGSKEHIGKCSYITSENGEGYCFSNFMMGIRFGNNVNSKFLQYCINNILIKKQINNNSLNITLNNLTNESVGQLLIPFPNLELQNKIANFLDIETSKIDRKISILEQKFDKLEEYKQSVIFETVTKGLDGKVAMKNSGIDWIGEIPSHWQVKRVKDLYMLKKGKNAGLYSADFIHDELNKGQFPVYSGQTENQGIMGNIKTFEYNFSNGVLFTTTVGAKAMSVKRLFHKFSLSQNCALLIPTKSIDLSYSYYSIASCFSFARQSIPSHMQPSLRKEDLNTFYCLDIPIKEQKEIGLCLDSFSLKIDKKKEIINKKIKLLQEYKQSVIFEAVTGKMEIL